jgi:hypothetical protein
MQAEPYASATRVFWVVDNRASHRNWAAADRMSSAYPNAQMVHLPPMPPGSTMAPDELTGAPLSREAPLSSSSLYDI